MEICCCLPCPNVRFYIACELSDRTDKICVDLPLDELPQWIACYKYVHPDVLYINIRFLVVENQEADAE